MTTLLFANNAQTTIAGPLTNVSVTIALATGAGSLFPNPGAGQAFHGTLVDASTGLIREIVLCTARTGDTLTVTRAQEGTSALSWSTGDIFAHLVTAGDLQAMAQTANISATPFVVDTGAANAYVLTPSPALVAYAQGIGYTFEATNANTGASTVNVSALGVKAIKRRDGTALLAGDIPAGSICLITYDGTNFQLQATNATYGTASGSLWYDVPGTPFRYQAGTFTSTTNTRAGSETFTFPQPFAASSRPIVTFGVLSVSGTTDNIAPAPPNGTLSVHKVALDVANPPTATGFKFWVSAEDETTDVFDGTITTFDWHAVGPKP